MQENDQIQRFLIQNTAIRGQLISLDASYREVLKRVKATGRAASILGESLAAICLLAATVKIEGKITLQIRGDGDLDMLVAQATSERTLRGLIRGHIAEDDIRDLKDLFNSDHIVLSIETGNKNPYQGVVPLHGANIASVLKAYFAQSEQLPTQLWLVSNNHNVSGLLLQQMPQQTVAAADKGKSDNDDWVRVQLLADTIKDEELLELSSIELLHRLFHEDDVQIFDSEPIRFACNCSKKRSAAMIASVGQSDIDDLLTERDDVEITCEFCNKTYNFDRVDVAEIFATQ